jgi:hypothetical protein
MAMLPREVFAPKTETFVIIECKCGTFCFGNSNTSFQLFETLIL